MRGMPPLEVTVRRFGWWRGALVLLGTAGLAATLSWWLALPAPRPGWSGVVAAAAVALALLPLIEVRRLRRLVLRWDGERWQVAEPGSPAGAVPPGGRLQVALDLGDWLLLRFVPDALPSALPRQRCPGWIALQRAGLELHWHALRCALYSPPPAGLPGGAPARSSE